MNFHILAKKNLGPGVAYNKFTTVRARMSVCTNDRRGIHATPLHERITASHVLLTVKRFLHLLVILVLFFLFRGALVVVLLLGIGASK